MPPRTSEPAVRYSGELPRPPFLLPPHSPQALSLACRNIHACHNEIMTKRSGALSVTVALLTLLFHSAAHAQSADLVLCDRIAADPTDPDKPKDVKGVAAIAPSDVATAIKFCRIASAVVAPRDVPARPRLCRQPANTEAMAAYRKAADKGSSAAMVELGVMYGTGAGVAKDQAQGARTVRTRRQGRQSARRHQSRGAFRRRRAAANPARGARHAGESGGGEFGGSAIPARRDVCARHRRPEGRRRRARFV